MVVGFFAISVYSGFVGYTNFQLENATDAGIITQAVASTAHGNAIPYYEYWDCFHKSRCSFLLVHPGLVLYAAVPFYQVLPSTVTLFALRSAVVAAAAVPLYWLARQVTRSSGKALLAAGLYLVWAPVFAGDTFSLHLESLFPIELILLAALWQSGHYRWGLAVAGVAFVTYEVSPLFTFLVGLFFLSPYLERALRRRWSNWRTGRTSPRAMRGIPARWARTLREGWRIREVRYLVVLMAASALAYVALSLFINVWGCRWLGVACPTVQPGILGIFSNPSSHGFHSPETILRSPVTVTVAEYWLILYALVAFIPLFSPRTLILSVPWIGWTFLTLSTNFATIGREYSLIAAGPLFIGVAFGLDRIHLEPRDSAPPAKSGTSEPRAGDPKQSVQVSAHRAFGLRRKGWAGALAVVVIANALLMPINPVLSDLGLASGLPLAPDYFDHSLEISPGYEWVHELVSVVPSTASFEVTSAVFPLVANDPRAYVAGPDLAPGDWDLPFNFSGGPQFVLVPSSVGALGLDLARNLSDPMLYGMRGYVGSSTLGPLLLYEEGYSLPAELFGPELPESVTTYLPSEGIEQGPKGDLITNSSAPSGRAITDAGGTNGTGLVWEGPDTLIPPGNYTLSIEVAVTSSNSTARPDQTALRIEVGGFGHNPLNETYPESQFVSGTWMNLSLNFSLEDPLPKMYIQGFLVDPLLSVAIASESVEPDG